MKSNAAGVKAPRAPRRRLVIPTADEVDAIAELMYGRYAIRGDPGERSRTPVGRSPGLARRGPGSAATPARGAPPSADTPRGRGRRSAAEVRRRLPDGTAGPRDVEALALHLAVFPARAGLVVTSASGRPVRRTMLGKAWTEAKERAGITRSLRFHDLRHRYASVQIEAKTYSSTIKTLMGHSSINETYDNHGHVPQPVGCRPPSHLWRRCRVATYHLRQTGSKTEFKALSGQCPRN